MTGTVYTGAYFNGIVLSNAAAQNPATIAVLDGRLAIGLSNDELERIGAGAIKVSSRDLGPAAGTSAPRRHWPVLQPLNSATA